MLVTATFQGYQNSASEGDEYVLLSTPNGDHIRLLPCVPGPGVESRRLSIAGTSTSSVLQPIDASLSKNATPSKGAVNNNNNNTVEMLKHVKVHYVLSSSSSAWSSRSSNEDDSEVDDDALQGKGCCTPRQGGSEEHFLPRHGAVIQLKASHVSDSHLVEATQSVTGIVPEPYRILTVLGYDEEGQIYLQPRASLDGATISMPASYVVEPLLALRNNTHVLRDAFEDITSSVMASPQVCCPSVSGSPLTGGIDNSSKSKTGSAAVSRCVRLPVLRRGNTLSPPISAAPLAGVFRVEAGQAYHLLSLKRTIRFVGVACGVPWISDCSSGSSQYCEPLPKCFHEGALIELYGLCDAVTEESQPPSASAAAAATPIPGYRPRRRLHSSLAAVPAGNQLRSPRMSSSSLSASTSVTPRGSTGGAATSLYFIRGPNVVVPGPYGVLLECAIAPEVLVSQYGVAHADRLRERTGNVTSFATVMGVSMGSLVVLYDHERKATVLRNVSTVQEVSRLYYKIAGTALSPPALPIVPTDYRSATSSVAPVIRTPLPRSTVASSTDSLDPTLDEPVVVLSSLPIENEDLSRASSQQRTAVEMVVDNGGGIRNAAHEAVAPPPRVSMGSSDVTPSAISCSVPLTSENDDCRATPAAVDFNRDPSLAPTDMMDKGEETARSSREITRGGNSPVQHFATPPPPPSAVIHRGSTPERTEATTAPHNSQAPRSPSKSSAPPPRSLDATQSAAAAVAESSPSAVRPSPHDEQQQIAIVYTASGEMTEEVDDDAGSNYDIGNVDAEQAVATPFTRFLKAYSLYQQRRNSYEEAAVTLPYLQQFYMECSLDRVMAAMEALRRCRALWAAMKSTSPSLLHYNTFDDMCVDEAAEFLEANAHALQL